MPTVRKLSPEEVQTIEYKGKGVRKLTEEQYDSFLADYELGDYGEAELDAEEKRLTVRNRLKAAAGRRGLYLHFNRTTGNVVRFKVVPENGQATRAKSPAASGASAKRRGGRPRKAGA
jgi:hypothetical protein